MNGTMKLMAGIKEIAARHPEMTLADAHGKMKWVNVYYVTRHYGGPEEGGWWWNMSVCQDSKLALEGEDAEKMKAEMIVAHAEEAYGNIYHSTGGQEVDVYIEDEVAESEALSSGGFQ